MPVDFSLGLALTVFCIGVFGVVLRRNPLVLFMCIEMMFNAANLAFVALANYFRILEGQALVFLVIAVAAAEVAVGLAIIIAIFRAQKEVNVDSVSALRG
jgi:NADH-quinone oxidoreductase subunit K